MKIIVACALLVLMPAAIFTACSHQRLATVHTAPCGAALLQVDRHREMVELAWQDRYHLSLRRPGAKQPVRLTGTVGLLPRIKRYRDMIQVADFRNGRRMPLGELFTAHYISPERITREEFERVCAVYRAKRDEWAEIRDTIGMLVYGDPRMFHEVFALDNGLYLHTDRDGHILITDMPAYEALTMVPEKRHANHVAFFDDAGRLQLRTGRIVSGVENDLFGRPSKRVHYSGIPGVKDYAKHVDLRWADLLYRETETGIQAELLFAARTGDGRRLDEVFVYRRGR